MKINGKNYQKLANVCDEELAQAIKERAKKAWKSVKVEKMKKPRNKNLPYGVYARGKRRGINF
ncbi:hypothetical protein ES707_02347 [subsurface metagenome]